MMKPLEEKIVFDENNIKVEQATFNDATGEFKRMRINRPDAAVVLVLNKETNKVILTRQYRYAVSGKSDEKLIEIVAGKVDQGEEPLATAMREVEEETGYRVKPENIWYILSCFVSPGYSSEKFHIYYATVGNADRVGEGGGLKQEHEAIEVVEMDVDDFVLQVNEGGIQDAKTYIAGMYLVHTFEHYT